MIHFKTGDIFTSTDEAIVNTVNCLGVMGKGLALQFKKKYPDNYAAYKVACYRNRVNPGKMFLTQTEKLTPKYIINFPTKLHWIKPSQIIYIDSGLDDLKQVIEWLDIQSISIPKLGCDNGKLDWSEVKQLIVSKLKDVNCEINIYE